MDVASEIGRNDLTQLENQDQYDKYFEYLLSVIHRLGGWYEHHSIDEFEENKIVPFFLERLVNTIKVLKLKYLYDPKQKLYIDASDSGFPNSLEFTNIEAEYASREDSLRRLPTEASLRAAMVDYMAEHGAEPGELLWQLSMRKYLTALGSMPIFRSFTPGEFFVRDRESGNGRYGISWGVFDIRTNRPYIHYMVFDQEFHRSNELMEQKGLFYDHVVSVIRRESSHVPPLNVLGVGIDRALDNIHPKIIRRIGLGPLYGLYTLDENPIMSVLEGAGMESDDFVLCSLDETLMSEYEESSRLIAGVPIQHFYVPSNDPLCVSRGASSVYQYMCLPHKVSQHLDLRNNKALEQYKKYRKITV